MSHLGNGVFKAVTTLRCTKWTQRAKGRACSGLQTIAFPTAAKLYSVSSEDKWGVIHNFMYLLNLYLYLLCINIEQRTVCNIYLS